MTTIKLKNGGRIIKKFNTSEDEVAYIETLIKQGFFVEGISLS